MSQQYLTIDHDTRFDIWYIVDEDGYIHGEVKSLEEAEALMEELMP